MRTSFIIALAVTLLTCTKGEAGQSPMKLNVKQKDLEKVSDDYFPPATEPYSSQIVQSRKKTEVNFYRPSYGGMTSPRLASREIIEKAAAHCDEEVSTIWALQQHLDFQSRENFQKSVGEAKTHCDQLKKIAYSMKYADEALGDYQKAVQKAQKTYNNTSSGS